MPSTLERPKLGDLGWSQGELLLLSFCFPPKGGKAQKQKLALAMGQKPQK